MVVDADQPVLGNVVKVAAAASREGERRVSRRNAMNRPVRFAHSAKATSNRLSGLEGESPSTLYLTPHHTVWCEPLLELELYMILTGYARIGEDAQLRYTPDGTAVANLSLAFNYGRRDDDGKRPTQWVDASLWGQRAESLIDYLVKGQGLDVVLEDPHIETYQRREGGEGFKLVARVLMLDSPAAHRSRTASSSARAANASRPADSSSAPAASAINMPIRPDAVIARSSASSAASPAWTTTHSEVRHA